jgi:hypothetical protein
MLMLKGEGVADGNLLNSPPTRNQRNTFNPPQLLSPLLSQGQVNPKMLFMKSMLHEHPGDSDHLLLILF